MQFHSSHKTQFDLKEHHPSLIFSLLQLKPPDKITLLPNKNYAAYDRIGPK